jgi:predicted amidohydrolase YtcJ
VAVGTNSQVDAFAKDSRVIDLSGDTVLPGLHDMHVHSLFAGLEQFLCKFAYSATPQEIVATVKTCAAQKHRDEWIEGGNWVAASFQTQPQNKALLDAVAPDNPVMLNDEAHHSLWVNSRALQLARITRDTPDPPGGVIERSAAGEPTGLLRETATQLVERIVPPHSDAEKRRALTLSTRQMLSFGITAYTDATVRRANMPVLSALSADGTIKQNVRGCIVWAPGDKDGEALIADRASYTRPRFSPDCVKIFVDGVPTESHTAAMLTPYPGEHVHDGKESAEKGMLMLPQSKLNEAVARFDRMGMHIKFHAAGDAAVRAAIDAVAYARNLNGWGGSSHDVGHNSFVDPTDIARVRDLHMTWEFSPYIWYPTSITTDVGRAVGDQLMARFIPIKEALDTGALVVAGSDWSVVPSVNPWLAMETMVTRQKPGGSAESIAPRERITLVEAFRIFTENGAALMGDRDRVGSIEKGMRADIIVTATNPFRVPITQVHATHVKTVYINGEEVFDAAHPGSLSAR